MGFQERWDTRTPNKYDSSQSLCFRTYGLQNHDYQEERGMVRYAERKLERKTLHFKERKTKGVGFFGTVDRNTERLIGTLIYIIY